MPRFAIVFLAALSLSANAFAVDVNVSDLRFKPIRETLDPGACGCVTTRT